MGFDPPHGSVQAEPVDIGAQRLAWRGFAQRSAPQGQRLLPSARPEGDAVGNDRRMTQDAGLLAVGVGVGVGEVGLPHLLDHTPPARENLNEPGNDGLQQRVQLVVGAHS